MISAPTPARLSDWLKANPSAVVEIEGHCDERGTNEYNMALGAKRAQAAMDYLTTLGVAADRLSTIRYGEELLVCEERTEDAGKKSSRPLRDSAYTACLLASFSRQRMPAKQANLVLKAT